MIEEKYLVFRDRMCFYIRGDVIETPLRCDTLKEAKEIAKEEIIDFPDDAPIYIAKIIKVVGETK